MYKPIKEMYISSIIKYLEKSTFMSNCTGNKYKALMFSFMKMVMFNTKTVLLELALVVTTEMTGWVICSVAVVGTGDAEVVVTTAVLQDKRLLLRRGSRDCLARQGLVPAFEDAKLLTFAHGASVMDLAELACATLVKALLLAAPAGLLLFLFRKLDLLVILLIDLELLDKFLKAECGELLVGRAFDNLVLVEFLVLMVTTELMAELTIELRSLPMELQRGSMACTDDVGNLVVQTPASLEEL